ncbi:unnamed protein product [Cyclocybe aegerita]|uniref:Uncharacterized protein n=1 Tax=Cyclocybe aegerita TaxID=1973307 RepID=A0A8S0W0V0_CYCAE|nr:unnamed protein product [Cyclocybe aegerita]
MVQLNATALAAVVLGAISVSAAPGAVAFAELEARNELSQLVQARDVAYADYETRERILNARARQLAARGYDVEELIFARAKTSKSEIVAWLNQGATQGAADFGTRMTPFHSGGTSRAPHCRPYGQKITRTETQGSGKKKRTITINEYFVMLKCAKDSKKPDDKVTIVSPFKVSGGPDAAPPSAATVYSQLLAHVNAMSSLPF